MCWTLHSEMDKVSEMMYCLKIADKTNKSLNLFQIVVSVMKIIQQDYVMENN